MSLKSQRKSGQELKLLKAKLSSKERQHHDLIQAARSAAHDLDPRTASPVDVMLVIDGTSSMKPSLDSTRQNLSGTIGALRVVSPTARVGLVVFRDKKERSSLRLQIQPLTQSERKLARFLKGIKATSTSRDKDIPEWLCGGLEKGIKARWRKGAIRIIILVSDADAQDKEAKSCIKAARRFRAQGGQLHLISTRPLGFKKQRKITRHYKNVVLPQHARIAKAGGGIHVKEATSHSLLTEVLQAAFRSRTSEPLKALREAVGSPDGG